MKHLDWDGRVGIDVTGLRSVWRCGDLELGCGDYCMLMCDYGRFRHCLEMGSYLGGKSVYCVHVIYL